MTVRKVLDRYYEGMSEDVKPTGVLYRTFFVEIDTNVAFVTYDGDNWVEVDSGLLGNIAALQHRQHARLRVYPRVAGDTITLISDGVADTFGAWTEIVPIDEVDFEYECRGMVIYGVDVASTYFIQLGCSITDGDEPTTAQILGEREIKIIDIPIAKATEPLEFECPECPANAKLWGRLKTDGGATDEAYITVLIARHMAITNAIAKLATWPWST